MYFGCAWYPEHWEPARWPHDLRLMRDAGMNVVRLGEFAWSRIEPREGQFELDWLEQAIALAGQHGIQSVVGTPTASPPAWLTQKYPEVLRVNPDGSVAQHGNRCHFNPASLTYQRFCRNVAEQMAIRLGCNPDVIGWQIDNEYWTFSYDPWTRSQFQQFLRRRYGTLDNLNARWTTSYWSQEYTDWSQIPMAPEWQHPALMLEVRRYMTEVYRQYQHVQVEAIRKQLQRPQWITHNFHGGLENGDPRGVAEELDLASWDPYVGSGHLDWAGFGLMHDLVRGIKRKNFWVIETQPGTVNWHAVNNPLDRGEVRTMAWHLAGHGADAVCYWQWRSALGGQEQYHGSIVAPSGKPRPLYGEVSQIGKEFAALSELLKDTTPAPDAAMLFSFYDRWAVNWQRFHKDFDARAHATAYYRAMRLAGVDLDLIAPDAPLDAYRLVIAPQLHIIDEGLVRQLLAYVENGGHLVLGARSGFKDVYNALIPQDVPGMGLAAALGGHVEEFYALDTDVAVGGDMGAGKATIWAEWLATDARDTQVLLRYSGHTWLENQAALITRPLGKGRISYVGAWLTPPLMDQVAAWMISSSGITPPAARLPEGVEACRRSGAGKDLLLLINHTNAPRALSIGKEMKDHLTGQAQGPEIVLASRQVMVLA